MLSRITSLAHYESEYQKSITDPENFWADKAAAFTLRKKWDRVFEWNFEQPDVRWFGGGQLNITDGLEKNRCTSCFTVR